MRQYNILVIALTTDIIAANFNIWKRVEAGDYTVVFASPEVLLQYGFVFLFCTIRNKCNTFNKRLACIITNEAHLI